MGDGPDPAGRGRPATQPYRSKPGGMVLFLFAALFTGGAISWAIHAYNTPRYTSGGREVDFEIVGGLLLLATGSVGMGRKLLAPSAEFVLAHDSRNPVVYLRPFDEDARRIEYYPVGMRKGGRKLMRTSEPASREGYLKRALGQIGPFIAVGAPGDTLAPLGAARLYLADEEWQREVEALVKGASAIVLVPETTEGTRWEVTKVARWVDLRRVLIIVPNPALRPLGYARIQALTAENLPVALPCDCASADAFMFDAMGLPQAISFGRDKAALQPFIKQVKHLPELRA